MDELSEDAEMAARAARRRVRGLVRPFAERLMTDTRLREALADDQAQPLLAWAVAQVEAQAALVAEHPDEAAQQELDAYTFQLGQMLRAFNQLMAGKESAEQAAPEVYTEHFDQWLAAMQGLGLAGDTLPERLAVVKAAYSGLDNRQLFAQLVALLPGVSAETVMLPAEPPRVALSEPAIAPAEAVFPPEPPLTLSVAPPDLPAMAWSASSEEPPTLPPLAEDWSLTTGWLPSAPSETPPPAPKRTRRRRRAKPGGDVQIE